jgi:hypothetical protein
MEAEGRSPPYPGRNSSNLAMNIFEIGLSDRLRGGFTVVFSDMLGYKCGNGRPTWSCVVTAAGSDWSVCIYPNGVDEASEGCLSCYLVNESTDAVDAAYTMVLCDERGNGIGRHQTFGSVTFAPRDDPQFLCMNGLSRVCPASARDSLTVRVSLATFGRLTARALDKLPSIEHAEEFARLRGFCFSPLLLTGLMSDFTILARRNDIDIRSDSDSNSNSSEDWVSFSVHKLILSFASPVLKTMIESGMSESASSELRITDADAEVVRQFVYFLYAGCFCEPPDAEPMLALAHRYEIPELQDACETILRRRLTTNNVLHVVGLAELYNTYRLKNAAIAYIARNASTLLQDPSFMSSMSMELCREVMCAMAGVSGCAAQPADADRKFKKQRLT